MTCPNPHLENISILDTPGFISNDKKDQERTIEVINECDALFWVIDVNSGTINRSSISVIKEKLRKPLYIVINKIDTKAESEIRNVENLLRKTMEKESIPVKKYIRFSSKAPLEEINNTIMSIPKTELRTTFVSEIGNDLAVLMEAIEVKYNELKNKLAETINESNSIWDQISACLIRLRDDCETACYIPTWTEHIFSKDCYEMSNEEYKVLTDLLQGISNSHIQYLAYLIEEVSNKTEEVKDQEPRFQATIDAWNKIVECIEDFNEIEQTFN